VVLTNDELVEKQQHEARILLHLVAKVDPAKLDYRPHSQAAQLAGTPAKPDHGLLRADYGQA
jgi:hypothetical protein